MRRMDSKTTADRGGTADETMTAAERAYFVELAADIIRNGDDTSDLEAAFNRAHERRQAFILEMIECKTPRSRAAREVLTCNVFAEINSHAALARAKEILG